jgi:hypothetical protein
MEVRSTAESWRGGKYIKAMEIREKVVGGKTYEVSVSPNSPKFEETGSVCSGSRL